MQISTCHCPFMILGSAIEFRTQIVYSETPIIYGFPHIILLPSRASHCSLSPEPGMNKKNQENLYSPLSSIKNRLKLPCWPPWLPNMCFVVICTPCIHRYPPLPPPIPPPLSRTEFSNHLLIMFRKNWDRTCLVPGIKHGLRPYPATLLFLPSLKNSKHLCHFTLCCGALTPNKVY